MDMMKVLYESEQVLPTLLHNPDVWKGIDIDYESPRVERLWTPFESSQGPCRLSVHVIHPCVHGLYHPHPWASAVRVVKNAYKMEVGYGYSDDDPPPVAATIWMPAGSAYEMADENAWHSVSPFEEVLSVMVTGTPWSRPSPGKGKAREMTTERFDVLLRRFQSVFCI